MTATPTPTSVGAKYARYSALWFSADNASADDATLRGICSEMSAIEEWAKTAQATSLREHEMLARILYAGTTGALGAGVLLAE